MQLCFPSMEAVARRPYRERVRSVIFAWGFLKSYEGVRGTGYMMLLEQPRASWIAGTHPLGRLDPTSSIWTRLATVRNH